MNDIELKRLLQLADARPPAPPDFRDELWEELDSAWGSRLVDVASADHSETIQLAPEEGSGERQPGWLVTLAAAAAVVVLLGLVPFLLTQSGNDVPPPLSAPELVVSPEDACLVFAAEGREVAHLISDSIENNSPGSPWFLSSDEPPSNQLVESEIQTLVNAMDALISNLEQIDDVEVPVVDSLRVIRGFYNQASVFLTRGDGGPASSSVESARGQWVQMSNRGLLEELPNCYPGT